MTCKNYSFSDYKKLLKNLDSKSGKCSEQVTALRDAIERAQHLDEREQSELKLRVSLAEMKIRQHSELKAHPRDSSHENGKSPSAVLK